MLIGEDRWLCTLLLQAGYKVEYSAAADALTYCPESFDEFYNQRRRWAPSTMANVVDLIKSFKQTVAKNNNISSAYMIYQILLFAASLISPGTILLSIAGSYRILLSTSFLSSYILAIEPAIFYIFICMTCKQNIQLSVAAVMSACYAVIMTVNIIGTLVSYITGNVLNPNLIFLLSLIAFFIIAGIMHPQELSCLLPAPMFLLCIPSGYLLLTIYSLCNLNVVSWGTREVTVVKTSAEQEKEEAEKVSKKKRDSNTSVLEWLGINRILSELKELYAGIKPATQSQESNQMKELMTTLLSEVRKMNGSPSTTRHESIIKQPASLQQTKSHSHAAEPIKMKRDALINPAWLDDSCLGGGEKHFLCEKELTFWNKFIKMYLEPIDDDKEKKRKTAKELAELRTFVVMGFSIINFLWIVITFFLQYLGEDDDIRERLYVPLGNGEGSQRFEPFGMLFLVFFSVILVLQFSASIIHRLGTLLHLLAVTDVLGEGKNLDDAFKILEDLNNLGVDIDDESTLYADASINIHNQPPELPDRPNYMYMNKKKILRNLSRHAYTNPDRDDTGWERRRTQHKSRAPQVVNADRDILTQHFLRKVARQKSMLPGNRDQRRRSREHHGQPFSPQERQELFDSYRHEMHRQRPMLPFREQTRHRYERPHCRHYGPDADVERHRYQRQYQPQYQQHAQYPRHDA